MSAGLSTLANVCDTAQKLTTPATVSTCSIWTGSKTAPLSPSYSTSELIEHNTPKSLDSDISHYTFPRSYSAPSVSENDYNYITLDPHSLPSSSSFFTVREDNKKGTSREDFNVPTSLTLESYFCHDEQLSIPRCAITSFTEFPTPPPTPDLQYAFSPSNTRHDNPLQRNAIAYAIFQQYLDETWPKDSQKIGGGVIRAALYSKITNTLLGGVAPARLRQWVKRSEFFLTNGSLTGYGARLAVPVHRLRQGGTAPTTRTGGKTKHTVNNTHRLVAQLEDFVHIIGCYHNDHVGHHGIRKTHAMIHEDYSHVPRTAVSKFIELCDVCSLHKHKNKTTGCSKITTKTSSTSVTQTMYDEAVNSPQFSKPAHQDQLFTELNKINKDKDFIQQ